jgi:Asp-tRNA(Asn)/Glu-tRNA(Gln) amidotransferase A subunit family amidase
LRGVDPDDLLTWQSLGHVDATPYPDHLRADGLKGARVGVLKDLFRVGEPFEPVNDLITRQIALMRQHGAVVIDGLTTGQDLVGLFPALRVNRYELRLALDAYFVRRGPASPIRNVKELADSGLYLKGLGNRFRESLGGEPLDFSGDYRAKIELQQRLRQQLVDLMDRAGVSALAYPFKSLGAPLVGVSDSGVRDNPISSTTGLPAIVIPAGMNDEGLPVSLELLGRPFSEPQLIRIAHGYEQASRKRVLPATTPALPGEDFSY